MLQHALATLAYRAGKALRGAPPEFGDFSPAPGSRTAGQILAHMTDLMIWGASIARRSEAWSDSAVQVWNEQVEAFFSALATFNDAVTDPQPDRTTANKLFQGPVADALQHTGQLTMMRRLAGSPIRGENYAVAEIVEGRVGEDQAPPRREF